MGDSCYPAADSSLHLMSYGNVEIGGRGSEEAHTQQKTVKKLFEGQIAEEESCWKNSGAYSTEVAAWSSLVPDSSEISYVNAMSKP